MKMLITSVAAISMLATASLAGSLTTPAVEPMVETMQDDDDSSNGFLLPLLALAAIAAVVASNSDSGT